MGKEMASSSSSSSTSTSNNSTNNMNNKNAIILSNNNTQNINSISTRNKPSNLSNDIKQLSNTALLSSIQLFNKNIDNNNNNNTNSNLNTSDEKILNFKTNYTNSNNSKSMSHLSYMFNQNDSTSEQHKSTKHTKNSRLLSSPEESIAYSKLSKQTNIKKIIEEDNAQSELVRMAGTTHKLEPNITNIAGENKSTKKISESLVDLNNSFDTSNHITSDLSNKTKTNLIISNDKTPNVLDTHTTTTTTPKTLKQSASTSSSFSTFFSPTQKTSFFSMSYQDSKSSTSNDYSSPTSPYPKKEQQTPSSPNKKSSSLAQQNKSTDNEDYIMSDPFDNEVSTTQNQSQNQKFTFSESENNDNNKDSNLTNNVKNFKDSKKKKKRSALAWVGRTVGKRVVKKANNHHNHLGPGYVRRHQSPQKYSTSSNQNIPTISNPNKKSNKIDWTDNAKQGTHIWSDVTNPQTTDSCYLSESDALEFHNLCDTTKCVASKNDSKKKCMMCKIVAHESCIELLQQYVKCRITFREATNKKKSFRDKEQNALNSSSLTSNTTATNVNLHHWVYRKFNEDYFENKCQACLKGYTNRFGLQSSRTIISCSWCKAAYHLKCFSKSQFKLECNFGEHNQLLVPPSWIVKSSNKNSLRSSYILKSYHRQSKRHHQQQQELKSVNCNPNLQETEALNTSTENTNSDGANFLLPYNPPAHTSVQQHPTRHSNHSFIIRPPPTISNQNLSLVKPLLVLINPKSGGKLGPKLLKKFTWLLNARQVFDLTLPGCPKLPLYLYRNVPNLRLLVGGGDGTVGWVLSVIDQIKFIGSPPSVAVLPLGTGNDLARALNWGSVYTDEPLSKILTKVLESRSVKLDRWKINTEPNTRVDMKNLEIDENAIDKLKNDVMNNYFSIGADAHVCLEFHERREANPHKFTSRWFNLLQYAEAGSKDIIKKTWRDLKDYIELECDGKNYTDLIRSKGYHCIILLNIPKYSNGTNPWGTASDSNYQPQSINDGRIEVIGCYTSTLAKIQLGGTGDRICQAKHIKMTTFTYIPIQIDGEPAKLSPSIIEIKHKNQSIMLEHVKYNTDSPILGYHSNIQKSFEVKCILMEDYEIYRKHTDILEKNAIYIGAICTANLTDSLSKVRHTVNLLIKNCANGFYTDKWSFLNGEEFYRVSDDSDECLLDIVSSEEIVYILDENPKFSNTTSPNELVSKKFKEMDDENGQNFNKIKEENEEIINPDDTISSGHINENDSLFLKKQFVQAKKLPSSNSSTLIASSSTIPSNL